MKKGILLISALVYLSHTGMSQTPSYIPTTGLVGYWPFTGNADDESGNGNNGNVNGPVLTEDRNGIRNQAYLFDGIDDQIIIPDAASLSLLNTNYTFNVWILPYDNGYHHIWYKGRSAGWDSLKYMFGWEKNKYSYHLNGPGLQKGIWAYSSTKVHSDWQMGTIVKLADTIFFYINGVFTNKVTVKTPVSNTNGFDVLIGSNEPEPIVPKSGWWNGKIDDIGLWNRALTECEILDIYHAKQNSVLVSAGNDTTLCLGDSLILSAKGSQNYKWNDGIEDGIPFQPGETMQYIVSADSAGCHSTDTVTIFVNEPTNSTLNESATDSFTLNGTTYKKSGTYTQIIMNSKGCDSIITLNLIIGYTSVDEIENKRILLYPNPAINGLIYLGLYAFDHNPIMNLQVSDLLGQPIPFLLLTDDSIPKLKIDDFRGFAIVSIILSDGKMDKFKVCFQ